MKTEEVSKLLGIKMKYDKDMHSYYGTIDPEPYDTGKDHFIPKFRSIFISGEMYPNTKDNFVYITSDLHGSMRLYRKHYWNEVGIANIFASGKTLKEAIENFKYNFDNKIYNIRINYIYTSVLCKYRFNRV